MRVYSSPEVLEKAIKKEIKEFLNSLGPDCYQYWPVPIGYGAPTIDCLGCYKGHFFGIEAKREKGGIVSAQQKRTMTQVVEAGGQAWVENDPYLMTTKEVFKQWNVIFSCEKVA